jgi:hypothetical protein
LTAPLSVRYTQRAYFGRTQVNRYVALFPEVFMAKKSFSVKMSSIATEIKKASRQLEKIRKNLAPKDRKRAALHLKKLSSAHNLVSVSCGHSMTAKYFGQG